MSALANNPFCIWDDFSDVLVGIKISLHVAAEKSHEGSHPKDYHMIGDEGCFSLKIFSNSQWCCMSASRSCNPENPYWMRITFVLTFLAGAVSWWQCSILISSPVNWPQIDRMPGGSLLGCKFCLLLRFAVKYLYIRHLEIICRRKRMPSSHPSLLHNVYFNRHRYHCISNSFAPIRWGKRNFTSTAYPRVNYRWWIGIGQLHSRIYTSHRRTPYRGLFFGNFTSSISYRWDTVRYSSCRK